MGGRGTAERLKRPSSRAGIVVLRIVSALVTLTLLTLFTQDLVDKASAPEPPADAVGETPPEEDDDDGRGRRKKPKLVRDRDPTVYAAQRDLDRCIRAGGSMGASSRRPGLDDDVRRITKRVERLRGLAFRTPVSPNLVSRSEVGERFAGDYLRRYTEEEARRDEQVLTALGLLPEGTDLRTLTASLLNDGVSGFYNPRTGRLFSASTGESLTPMDEVVLAHELDHALVDQAFRLPGTLSRDPMLGDVMLAHQALAEGDATLLMSQYAARRFPADEFESFMARFSQRTVQAPTPIPYFLSRGSEFPYFEGLLFVCGQWSSAWGSVDEMYRRPPATTADVLFPDRYFDDNDSDLPRAPSPPGRSWGLGEASSFGAFDLMLLLENADLTSKGETVAGSHVDAVRGWDGGVLHAWARGDETTVHIGLVDAGVRSRGGRSRRLCGVLRRWVVEAFPGAAPVRAKLRDAEAWKSEGDIAVLRCKGSAVELAKGPSGRAVRAVLRD